MKFEDFERILEKTIKEFKQINKISYIGIFGSRNMGRDIDVLIGPDKKSKKGVFLKILCDFLELLKRNLNRENSRLVVVTHSILQEEIKYISKMKKGKDVLLHISSFADFIPGNEDVKKGILKTVKLYYGKEKSLWQYSKTNKDNYYNYLLFSSCLFSNYPKELETNKTHEKILYIYKHNNGKINLKGKTNKQIYLECCDFLDSISTKF